MKKLIKPDLISYFSVLFIIVLIIALIGMITGLMGCAEPQPETVTVVQGPAGPQGPAGNIGPTGTSATTEAESLEGYYTLPNGGYIDIVEDSQGMCSVRTSRLVFQNMDFSLGLVPITSTSYLPVVNGKIYSNGNVTYAAATHNVKQDFNSSPLNGSYFTELLVWKVDGVLAVRVLVNTSNSPVFDHTVFSNR